jgi:hypothetical protein
MRNSLSLWERAGVRGEAREREKEKDDSQYCAALKPSP